MQKQALKGLFFNISTCFSPLLAVFLTGENSLMFFRLPTHSFHLVRRSNENSPHAAATCLYNKVYPFGHIAIFLVPNYCLFVHPQTLHFFPILAKLERIA